MTKVALLDYGMGNLHSASKALASVGADVYMTNDPKIIQSCDKIFFPGVGAMADCIKGMQQAGIDEVVRQAIYNKPVMAICVGMQALFEYSEENAKDNSEDNFEESAENKSNANNTECLAILEGSVKKFDSSWTDPNGDNIKVPHMGWNTLKDINTSHELWQGIDDHTHFYFVHSYYCQPTDESIVAGVCDYGTQFCATVIKDNLFATQFHPEKSHTAGLQLLKNFVDWKI